MFFFDFNHSNPVVKTKIFAKKDSRNRLVVTFTTCAAALKVTLILLSNVTRCLISISKIMNLSGHG